MNIHPTAIIDPAAELDGSVKIGPYVIIEKGVKIGSETTIKPHTVISGPTTIGSGNEIGPFATIGAPPQDLKYKGEDTELVIGDNNIIREYVSIHRGTVTGNGITIIGNNNLLMGYVHIAHDCVIGNSVILANGATMAGHIYIDDHAIIGGLVAIHQFSRVGAYSYIGGHSGISKDVPPFIIVSGTRKQMRVSGINKIGLRRHGFDNETLKKLDKAYKIIFMTPDLLLKDALEKTENEIPDCEPVSQLIDFFRSSKQGVIRTIGDSD
ncbi:MAG: acyl-ACP--UDP-N-acetylglucosamine O-acyltransferase [Deltaproteobacteria bacterium]|jgi:UDP-N-acetylglucosamine acyltransferase|nr:acyl-ACP--UDP-N-acetylglucosamine O-acyltransferase [Deltaproteobacteria bacterium]